MDTNILNQIKENLKIPISKAVKENDKIIILYNNSSIGFLPIYNTEKGIEIDFSNESKMKLDWSKIFMDNQSLFFEKASTLVEFNSFKITVGSFRTIYIKDNDSDKILLVDCLFYNDNWNLEIVK